MTIPELRNTPMPERIAALPRDRRGYPVPYFAAVVDGQPDLKLLDQRKQVECVRKRLCGICGQPIGPFVAFITGPQGAANRLVTDPGMHEECARYALAVCPFMTRPNARRAASHHPDSRPSPGAVPDRPDRTALYITRSYKPYSPDGQNLLIRLALPIRIEWFRDGSPIDERTEAIAR